MATKHIFTLAFLVRSFILIAFFPSLLLGYSWRMNNAIRLYESGKYEQAVDAFIDIMADGSAPEVKKAGVYMEKALAKITQGNSSGASSNSLKNTETLQKTSAQFKSKPESLPQKDENDFKLKYVADDIRYAPSDQIPEKSTPKRVIEPLFVKPIRKNDAEQKKLFVESKLASLRNFIINEFEKIPGVKIYIAERKPIFATISPDILFSNGANFNQNIETTLTKIAALMITSGHAHFTILPQDSYLSRAEVGDMRRAMALKLFFLEKGISPARMSVHLGNTFNMELSRKFAHEDGIVIVFDYEKALVLKSPFVMQRNTPPEISLGIFPSVINAARGEGLVTEFSAVETASKLAYWSLKLIRDDGKKNFTLVQKATGRKPAYHQIYWNGRKNFTGSAFYSGKYICILSAVDTEGRKSVISKSVKLVGGSVVKKGMSKSHLNRTSKKSGGIPNKKR